VISRTIGNVPSWRREARSGLVLAAKIMLVLLVFILLALGLGLMFKGSGLVTLLGIVVVAVTDVFLFATAPRWAKWVCPACIVNILRLLVMTALGRTISVPSIAAPRALFVELIIVAAMMCFLTYRFMFTKPTRLDSIALVGAVTAIVYSLSERAPIRWLLAAVLLLGIAFFVSAIRNRLSRRRRGQTNGSA
jgi:hypothetical protein